MARLDELATELILDILSRVPPQDLEAASLISKRVYRAAGPLLDEHRKVLEEQYRVWDRDLLKEKDPSHEHTNIHTDLLCTVSTDQRLAKLVQTLRVGDEIWRFNRGNWRLHEEFPGAVHGFRISRRQAPQRTRIQILRESVRENEMVHETEKDAWIYKLRARSEGNAVLLLLWTLPALHNFQINLASARNELPCDRILQMIERIVARLASPSLAAVPVAQPCQNLKHIMIEFDPSEFTSIALVRAFLSLPSVSSLNCRSLVMNPRSHKAGTGIISHPSTIKYVLFYECLLNMQALTDLLSNASTLKNFAYACSLSGESASFEFEEEEEEEEDYENLLPNAHIALPVIASSIGQSLETMALSTSLEGSAYITDRIIHRINTFKHLYAVKRLSVSTNLLIEDFCDIPTIASNLPPNLECLVLRWIRKNPVKDIDALQRALWIFMDQTKIKCPSLRALAVRGIWDENEKEKLCTKNGKLIWDYLGHLEFCPHHMCECTMWDMTLHSDIDWRHFVGDPNPGAYKTLPEKPIGE